MIKKGKVRKLKVLFITEFFPTNTLLNVAGGVEVRTYNAAAYLAGTHQVFVIASREKGQPYSQKINGISVIRPGFESYYSQKDNIFRRSLFLLAAFKAALFLDVDLIEGTGFIGHLVVRILSSIKYFKAVAFVPDTFTDFSHHFGFFGEISLPVIEKLILRSKWDGYIVISQEIKKKLLRLNIAKTKIEVIYCGVDFEKIRQIKSIKTRYPSICVISRLVSYKNIDTIISAIYIVKEKFPNITCNIIGRGELLAKYQKLIQKLMLQKNIKLHGFIPDRNKILAILKSSWLYCSASTVEGFGIATVEAMVSKIPFVISDIPVNQEITGGIGGLFFAPQNPADLAKKITQIIKLGKKAKKILTDPEPLHKYSSDYMGHSTENYFNYLVNS